MPEVKYTDSEGYAYLVRVPDGTSKSEYAKGIVLGPPDLREIGLSLKDELKLRHHLVDAGLVNAQTIKGSNQKLASVVKRVLSNKADYKGVVRWIKSIYQRDLEG